VKGQPQYRLHQGGEGSRYDDGSSQGESLTQLVKEGRSQSGTQALGAKQTAEGDLRAHRSEAHQHHETRHHEQRDGGVLGHLRDRLTGERLPTMCSPSRNSNADRSGGDLS
jgi:hypothetical protein